MTTALQSTFKTRLAHDEPLIGLWLTLGDTITAEICAGAGFDWVLVDAEHGPYDLRAVLGVLQALAAAPDCAAVVRVPVAEPWLIKQYLDVGVTTVLVPMVDTAEQARAVVEACKYPPVGTRGVGAARASRWSRTPNYIANADDGICVLVQVETTTALENLEEIGAVEGVDGIFIGTADLAASMGRPGGSSHPEVQAAVVAALSRVRELGLPAGILATAEEAGHAYLEQGAKFVAVGIDAYLLVRATSDLARRFGR